MWEETYRSQHLFENMNWVCGLPISQVLIAKKAIHLQKQKSTSAFFAFADWKMTNRHVSEQVLEILTDLV